MKYVEVRKQEMNEVLEALQKYPKFKDAYIMSGAIRVKHNGVNKSICWFTHDGFRIGRDFRQYFDGESVKPCMMTERDFRIENYELKIRALEKSNYELLHDNKALAKALGKQKSRNKKLVEYTEALDLCVDALEKKLNDLETKYDARKIMVCTKYGLEVK